MDGMGVKILGGMLCGAAPAIHEDMLIVIDPTDSQKSYAEKMECLAKVWVGSEERSADDFNSYRQLAM